MSLIVAAMAQAAAPASIEGLWRSPGGNSIISIAPCGESLCGTVAWASAKARQDSARVTDHLIGTQLLTGLQQDRKGIWRGKLFIPDRNMRVTAKIERVSEQQLKVSGCAAGRALCKSALWTRTDEPLPASD
ncbi:MAG: DUF2147 domain-containing protein [Bacillota bacterium]